MTETLTVNTGRMKKVKQDDKVYELPIYELYNKERRVIKYVCKLYNIERKRFKKELKHNPEFKKAYEEILLKDGDRF
jgi:hypothetical protein